MESNSEIHIITNNTLSPPYQKQELIKHWTPINNLLQVLPCNHIYLALFNQIQYSSGETKIPATPILEKWISHTENIQNQHSSILKQFETTDNHKHTSLEVVRESNRNKGGTDEVIEHIFPDHGGRIVIVFIDTKPPSQLVSDIRRKSVDNLLPYLTGDLRKYLKSHLTGSISRKLTKRELEVLYWIKEGKIVWETAKILEISERTVKYHLSNIYKKLEANNRSQAITKASELGLL